MTRGIGLLARLGVIAHIDDDHPDALGSLDLRERYGADTSAGGSRPGTDNDFTT